MEKAFITFNDGTFGTFRVNNAIGKNGYTEYNLTKITSDCFADRPTFGDTFRTTNHAIKSFSYVMNS